VKIYVKVTRHKRSASSYVCNFDLNITPVSKLQIALIYLLICVTMSDDLDFWCKLLFNKVDYYIILAVICCRTQITIGNQNKLGTLIQFLY